MECQKSKMEYRVGVGCVVLCGLRRGGERMMKEEGLSHGERHAGTCPKHPCIVDSRCATEAH